MAFLVLCASFALAGGIIAKIKGSSFFIWAIICAIPPYIGLIAVILYRYDRDELRRECPGCGRVVKLHDAICTRCGSELDFPDYAIEPESATAERV